MKRMCILIIFLFSFSLQAQTIGIVNSWTGNVQYKKEAGKKAKKMRNKLTLRKGYVLVVGQGSKVEILSFSGKMIGYDKPGEYVLDSEDALISYQDISLLNSTLNGRKIGTSTGGTRGKSTGEMEILGPDGFLATNEFSIRWEIKKKGTRLKELQILKGDEVIWKRNAAGLKGDEFKVDLKNAAPETEYVAVVRYTHSGKENMVDNRFQIAGKERLSDVQKEMDRIDKMSLEPFLSHYFKALAYNRHKFPALALEEAKKSKKLNPDFALVD